MRPVDAEAKLAPKRLEDLLVLLGELFAELDEVAARDRDLLFAGLSGRLEAGVVGKRWLAPDAEVVLHAPLGGKAVVVPPHRVEDLASAHALVAGDGVGVGVAEDVPDVQ